MTSPLRQLHLLPPEPNACQTCARVHGATVSSDFGHRGRQSEAQDEPHDANSLFYQLHFKLEHGRDPTWADARHEWHRHCSEQTKAAWVAELKERGIEV